MSKGKGKVIDYLFEDPEITNQKYALVSIVGPHMPQKCDVWGLKVESWNGRLGLIIVIVKEEFRRSRRNQLFKNRQKV